MGIERFYLYQNRSDDDWRNILQPYLDEGVVEFTEWPLPSPCQQAAYGHFFNQHRGKPRWVAFLDCDESGRQVSGPLTLRLRHRLLRVNHYVTKSREEYVRRISRGRADMPAQRDPSEFDSYQAAEVNDQAILRFLPALKSRLERTKARGHF